MDTDKAAIGEVLVRYATGIDQKDWVLLRTCWTDQVLVDYDQLGMFHDPDALTDVMRKTHEAMGPTYHRLSNFVIDVEGDRATARTYVHAVLMLRPGDSQNWIEAVGHYEDVLVRTDDGWRISERTSRIGRVTAGGDLATAATSGRS